MRLFVKCDEIVTWVWHTTVNLLTCQHNFLCMTSEEIRSYTDTMFMELWRHINTTVQIVLVWLFYAFCLCTQKAITIKQQILLQNNMVIVWVVLQLSWQWREIWYIWKKTILMASNVSCITFWSPLNLKIGLVIFSPPCSQKYHG